MRKLFLLIALIGLALMLVAPAASATGSNNHHKVWVCKYVGKPGDFETLKAGKQPIQVDVSAADDYVGADFADGQTHSFVIDLVTEANTDQHNDYTGGATCPTPPATTTSTTLASSTSTSAPTTTVEPPTTTSLASTSTTSLPSPTTTSPEATTTTSPPTTLPTSSTSTVPVVESTTTVPSSTSTSSPTTTLAPSPSTTASAPSSSPSSTITAELPFTGVSTILWPLGAALLAIGVLLLVASPWRRQ